MQAAAWPRMSDVDAIPGVLVIAFGVKPVDGHQDDTQRHKVDETISTECYQCSNLLKSHGA